LISPAQLINAQVSRDESKTAFIFQDTAFSYQQVDQITEKIAAQFLAQFEPYELLALWLPNNPEIIFAYIASFKTNVVPMPMHFGSRVSEVSKNLSRANVRHLVVAGELKGRLTEEALAQTQVEKVWCLEGCHLKLLFECSGKPVCVDRANDVGRDAGLVLHTSGSSGLPKGVVLSRESLSRIIEDRVTTTNMRNDSFAVVASSLSHSVGLYQVLALLSQGAGFVLLSGYDSDLMVKSINERCPSHLVMVVSAFRQILDHPDINAHAFHNIVFASVGADRVTQKVQDKFRALTGKSLSVSYGMTELSWILVNKEQHPEQCLALGRPTTGTRVELRDEKGRIVPQGSTGEIFAHSRKSMLGYLNQSTLNSAVMEDGWIRSGDLAYKDEQGLYWFAGRATDLIVLSSGDNVSPLEVEQEILTLPGVTDCIVLGMKNDELDSEVPWAFITHEKSHRSAINPGRVLEHLETRLSDYKIPQKLYFLDELPRGVSGKLSRKEMRQWCIGNLSRLDELGEL
jgi:long-chain acyl-CoA synthetase